jgi:hypothetical protein
MRDITDIPGYVQVSCEGVSVRRRWWTRMRPTDAAQGIGKPTIVTWRADAEPVPTRDPEDSTTQNRSRAISRYSRR